MITADIFANGMVLQRNQPIAVWGDCEPREAVHVVLGSDVDIVGEAWGNSDGAGRWSVMLPPASAARDMTLTIESSSGTASYSDVCVGEVWVAAGQSNMEFQLEFDTDFDAARFAGVSEVRFFDVSPLSYLGQETEHDYSKFEIWRRAEPDDLPYFSAVGYYFASRIADELGVPVGIVGCNWGGTPACTWADRARLAEGAGRVWIDDFERGLEAFDRDAEALAFQKHPMSDRSDPFGDVLVNRAMRESLNDAELRALQPEFVKNVLLTLGTLHPNRPGGLFETMVRRIAPYSLSGVLWYQGESDVPHPDVHHVVFGAVVDSWRSIWGRDELPFLVTQLAPFGGNVFGSGELFPLIRAAQSQVASSRVAVWVASSGDAGHPYDIHPKRKKPIGVRLALLALHHVYGSDIQGDAPVLRSAVRKGSEIRLELEHAHGVQWNGTEQPFDVTTLSGNPVKIEEFSLDGESLVLGIVEKGPVVVRFAMRGFYEIGISNDAGIPLLPFEVRV